MPGLVEGAVGVVQLAVPVNGGVEAHVLVLIEDILDALVLLFHGGALRLVLLLVRHEGHDLLEDMWREPMQQVAKDLASRKED
eukprot:5931753-Alexandrium_andersonii.AAC.1